MSESSRGPSRFTLSLNYSYPRKNEKAVALQTVKSNRFELAEPTGLEPATSDVTGRRSNQLNYDSAFKPKISDLGLKSDL
jgi:hypothetical protein